MSCFIIKAKQLRKYFGQGHTLVRAVDGISLNVRAGEITLIEGPSGAGKTTLLTLLGLLLTPDKGTIIFNNQTVTDQKIKHLARFRQRNIGFIFQSFHLLSSLTALENVQIVMDIAGSPAKKAQKKASRLLKELGLSRRLHYLPKELSGGEKQRVSIARAIANEPQLILADEPTANLDSKAGHEVAKLLSMIAKKQQRAVIIVSHDTRIVNIADKVFWLEDGKIKHKHA